MLESIASSKFVSHEARILGEFDLMEDSLQTNLERRAQILVKLSFKEWYDSKLFKATLIMSLHWVKK